MRCPYCDSQNTRVLHTRRNAEDKRTYRRNECNDCGEMPACPQCSVKLSLKAELPTLRWTLCSAECCRFISTG